MFIVVFVFDPCFRQIAMVDSTRGARSRRQGSRMNACGPLDPAPSWQKLWCFLAEPPPLWVEIPSIPNRRAQPATSPKSSDGTTWRPVTNNTVPRLTPASNPRGPWCFPLSARLTAG
jgi:hypothetical protein